MFMKYQIIWNEDRKNAYSHAGPLIHSNLLGVGFEERLGSKEISQNASEQTPTLTAGSPLKEVLILPCLEVFLNSQVLLEIIVIILLCNYAFQ